MTRYLRSQQEPRRAAGGANRFRPRLEALETRALLSVYTVDRLTDLGEGKDLVGDLRYCIEQANANPDEDTITFRVTGTINLTRALPDLTASVAIEGPGPDLLTIRRSSAGYYRIFTAVSGTTVTISGLTIANGETYGGDGGGIWNAGDLTVSHSTLADNYANGRGGGIYNAGTLTVSHSTLARNRSETCGSSCGYGHGGGIYNAGTAVISHSTLIRNSAGGEGDGGGIQNESGGTLTVSHSTIAENEATYGGGIDNAGTLTVSQSTLSDNWYGGITNYSSSGTLTVSHSTLAGNTGFGIENLRTLTVSHSTLTANMSGGIWNSVGGRVTVTHSTLAGNRLLGIYNAGTLMARNTILAGHTSCDICGNLGSLGHNLIGNTRGGSGFHETDLLDVDPLLGPLQDNGGPTLTHALLPGSPALDTGDNTDAPEFDQRGLPRIVADIIDIGAFEVQLGPATWFWLDTPAIVAAGIPFDITLNALDDYGHLATGYQGTVSFFATDKGPGVLLPPDYTFTADDQGIHTFASETVLVTPGEQSLWALDADGKFSGKAIITVVPSGAPGEQGGRRGTVLDWALATDLVRALTRRPARTYWLWAVLPEEGASSPDPAQAGLPRISAGGGSGGTVW